MRFNQDTMKLGGRVRLPGNWMKCEGYGEIIEVTSAGIRVRWQTGNVAQIGYFAFVWLEFKYGDKDRDEDDLDQPIPNMC